MKKISTFILSMLLIWTIVITTACPSQASIERAESASKQIAPFANEAVNLTRDLYRAKVISPELADKIADGFIYLSDGGLAFDEVLQQIKAQITGAPSKEVLARVVALFNSNIVDRFIDVLEKMKLINVSAELRAAIQAIKTTVLLIAKPLGVRKATEIKLQGA